MGCCPSLSESIPTQVLGSFPVGRATVVIVKGELSQESVDLIVSASNMNLQHSLDAQGSLLARAGPSLQSESDEYVKANGPVPIGNVVMVGPGKLKSKAILHAVGPLYVDGSRGEAKILEDLLSKVWECAVTNGFLSVSIPPISCGVFCYPAKECAELYFKTIVSTTIAEVTIRVVSSDLVTAQAFLEVFLAK